MRCRPTKARARRLALLGAAAALLGVSGWPAPAPRYDGSAAAWAETQQISDGATATASDRVRVDDEIKITGTGWKTPSGEGSVIAVRLDDAQIERTLPVINPASGEPLADLTIVAAVRASREGSFAIMVPTPEHPQWIAGSRHSIRLVSGGLLDEDATRSVTLSFDLVSEVDPSPTAVSEDRGGGLAAGQSPTSGEEPTEASVSPAPEDPSDPAPPSPPESSAMPRLSRRAADSSPAMPSSSSPTPASSRSAIPGVGDASVNGADGSASSASPAGNGVSRGGTVSACVPGPAVTLTAATTVRGVPVADLGGTLTLVGRGFCHPTSGGSTIAVQIDDGQLARVGGSAQPDRSIWQIIEVADDGTFRAAVRLPLAHETDPAFTDGSHKLRLVTGSLRADDPVVTLSTGEFVVAPGNHAGVLPEPTRTPRPVDPEVALVGRRANAVTVRQAGSTIRLEVPSLEPGDWVFPYAFDPDSGGRIAYPTTWLQLAADRTVVLDLADYAVTGASGRRVSLQARDGMLVGWGQIAPFDAVSGAAAPSRPTETEATISVGRREPRPLALLVGVGLVIAGIAGYLGAQRRPRR